MLFANIFYSKIVDDESEHDGSPFVPPKPWSGFALVVTTFSETGCEKLVCEDARLREPVNALSDFEVNPIIVDTLLEVVLGDEFVGDVGELDFDVLWSVKWSLEIKVGDIEGAELGVVPGEHTVDH